MMNIYKKALLGFIAIAFNFGLTASSQAQTYQLQKIELFNMASFYRILVQCDGPVTTIGKFDKSSSTLTVYLKSAKLDLSKSDFIYRNGLVREIHVEQLKKTPAIAKITVILSGAVEYQIKKSIMGLFYIDLSEPDVPESADISGFSEAESFNYPAEISGLFESSESKPFSYRNTFLESKSLRDKSAYLLPPALNSSERISLDVKGAQLANVLRLISKQGNINIVASQDVKATITVSLANVTIREALDLVIKANGMDYIVKNEVILVKPRDKFEGPELETMVYRLKYVDANNIKNAATQVLSPLAKIQVYYHSYQAEQTPDEDGKGSKIKNRSSTLIVTDAPENIQQLNAMIAVLDVPTPQIMIEAKLIEISPQSDEKLGIDWSKTINAQIFREVILPSGVPQRQSAEIPLTGGGINYGTLTFDEYGAVIDFLNSNTNSKLISNPRILAMDNQEAYISVGTTFPIPQITRGVGGQGDVVTFQYRDVSITLRVTPHVSDNGTITLFVNPEIEEVIGQVSAGGNSAPITSKRSVATVVNLKNNETMVIGGLIRENTIETISKIWLLGDIPLIGNLFRHKSKTTNQTDLLIFITPRLVTGS